MRAYVDVGFQRIPKTTSWRFRLCEAAANTSMTFVERSLRHNNGPKAMQWMERLQYFREKARLYS
jgi:hypothetical protein